MMRSCFAEVIVRGLRFGKKYKRFKAHSEVQAVSGKTLMNVRHKTLYKHLREG
jgi:hypothetical protein